CKTEQANAKDSTEKNKAKTIAVKVQEVTKQPVASASLFYTGTIEAKNTVRLSFQTPGKVQQVYVQEGDDVRKGQLLAALEQVNYLNQSAMSQAQLTMAQDAFNRIEMLHKKQSIPESEYVQAKARLQQAKAQHALNQKQLQDTRLTASFTGTIARKNIEEGMTVSPEVPAYEIVNLQRVYAVVAVPESEIHYLKVGDKVTVKVSDVTEGGTVQIIAPVADPSTRSYQVKVELPNKHNLRGGMLVETAFKGDSKTTKQVMIPSAALLHSPKYGDHVFITNDRQARLIKVEVGATANDKILINKGLIGGERLIVAGQHKLRNGTPISL
ncbi:MAG: efflux RND transporter periplasmic adaptor subunit, partial [Bacteroidota bacterium]